MHIDAVGKASRIHNIALNIHCELLLYFQVRSNIKPYFYLFYELLVILSFYIYFFYL